MLRQSTFKSTQHFFFIWNIINIDFEKKIQNGKFSGTISYEVMVQIWYVFVFLASK